MGARSAAARQRRDEILQAGLSLFLERGVAATTVAAILGRCGASIGSFYHQFDSKADVAAALYLETLEAYERAFLTELATHVSARRGIEATVAWHLQWTARNPDSASYLFHCREPEVVTLSEARAHQINSAFYAELLAWLGARVAAGEVRKLPSDAYFPLWMGPANEFTRLWLLNPGRGTERIARAQAVLAAASWAVLRATP